MPLLTIGDTTVYYRLEGGDDRPVLMLSHSLGQDHGMWDPQAADLAAHFRVLRYDIRGHGASGVTPGDYRIEQLGADALALADALGIDHFAFCGLSLGGMIGQWLAAHAADRVDAAILANTSARADSAGMETRRRTVLSGGMQAVADTVMRRFFSPRLLEASAPAVATAHGTLLATDPTGYAGCCAAIRDMDLTATLGGIRAPVLIISGDNDVSLPWTGHGDALARGIAHARVVHLPTAHLSNLEAPRSFTAALMDFLLAPAAALARRRLRRATEGARRRARRQRARVRAERGVPGFITRYAWGTIWTRPLLDIRTRRLLVLAMTAAMGRWDEFRLHVRTGLVHELEWCDLEEVLLQTAIYAGVPAADTGLHIASEERRQQVK